jgi:hypothetical protein
MANVFVVRAEASVTGAETLHQHIVKYSADASKSDKAHGKVALVVIEELQKKLEELHRRLQVALE